MNKQELIKHVRDPNAKGHSSVTVNDEKELSKWSLDELHGVHMSQHGGMEATEQAHAVIGEKPRRNFWSY